jgi:hypothetical protein
MPDPISSGAAILGSSVIGAVSSKNAADTQANAANRAADLQNQQYQQTRQDQMPWMQAGQRALGKLEAVSDYTPFGMSQFTQDPGYAFRLKEGQRALDASAAARGGLISGNALRAAQGYGQEMGSQEYQNAFNRYQAERQARLGPLQSLAGVGQTTAQQLGQTGAANAANVGNYLTGGAAAQAAGGIGAANAISGGVSQYLNYNQGNNLLNVLNNRNLVNQYGAGNVYTPQGGGNTNLSWNGEI